MCESVRFTQVDDDEVFLGGDDRLWGAAGFLASCFPRPSCSSSISDATSDSAADSGGAVDAVFPERVVLVGGEVAKVVAMERALLERVETLGGIELAKEVGPRLVGLVSRPNSLGNVAALAWLLRESKDHDDEMEGEVEKTVYLCSNSYHLVRILAFAQWDLVDAAREVGARLEVVQAEDHLPPQHPPAAMFSAPLAYLRRVKHELNGLLMWQNGAYKNQDRLDDADFWTHSIISLSSSLSPSL